MFTFYFYEFFVFVLLTFSETDRQTAKQHIFVTSSHFIKGNDFNVTLSFFQMIHLGTESIIFDVLDFFFESIYMQWFDESVLYANLQKATHREEITFLLNLNNSI